MPDMKSGWTLMLPKPENRIIGEQSRTFRRNRCAMVKTRAFMFLAIVAFLPAEAKKAKKAKADASPTEQVDDEDRTFSLNQCSMCQATASHAGNALWVLSENHAKGNLRYSATEALEQVCDPKNEVWKNYTMTMEGHIVGPGIAASPPKNEFTEYPGVSNLQIIPRLTQACSETLTSG